MQEEDLKARLTGMEEKIQQLTEAQEQQRVSTTQAADPRVDTLVKELKPYGIHSSLYVPPAPAEDPEAADPGIADVSQGTEGLESGSTEQQ